MNLALRVRRARVHSLMQDPPIEIQPTQLAIVDDIRCAEFFKREGGDVHIRRVRALQRPDRFLVGSPRARSRNGLSGDASARSVSWLAFILRN